MDDTIRIDGIAVALRPGMTVLDAAREVGVAIPTLCHLRGYAAFTSCMVCLVENEDDGRLIPACSTPAGAAMRIGTRSARVAEARRVALELLLGEHVGDCEGPCRVVCPAGLAIPRLLRCVTAGDWDRAAALARAAQPPCCLDQGCAAPCERVCRRGRVDQPVAIRALVQAAWALTADSMTATVAESMARNVSVMGRIDPDELRLMMKDVSPAARQDAAIVERGGAEAMGEAARCMHCDCSKADRCGLRDLAVACEARQRRFAGEQRPRYERQDGHPDVIYEPGKCIKCGICVRITERAAEALGLSFIGRGFGMRIGVPFDHTLAEGLRTAADACIRHCPTGALSASGPA